MKNAVITAAFLMISIACYPMGNKKIRKIMDSWLGNTKHELIQKWGPPTSTSSDGAKGEVLTYSNRIYTPGYYISMGSPNSSWMPGEDYYINRMMYVDSNGVIYSWRYNTTDNPPQRVNVDADVYIHK